MTTDSRMHGEVLRTRAADPMDKLAWHDDNPLPVLNAQQYADLRDSLKRGYLPSCPISVSAGPAHEGELLDGWHRSEICAELGIEPVVVRVPCKSDDHFKVLRVELNAARRQMTATQIAYARYKIRDSYDRLAKDRQEASQAQNRERDELGRVLPVTANLLEPGNRSERETAARLTEGTGIGSRTASKLMQVFEKADERTIAEVVAGDMSVDRAYKQVRSLEQQAALDSAVSNEAIALAEIAETVSMMVAEDRRTTYDTTQQRAAGEAIRMAMELDRHLQKHRLMDQDILDYRDRPHTFAGVSRRLADWLDLAATALELNR